MIAVIKNGQTSVVLRFKLLDSSSTSGAGLTGLTNASSGLRISTIADNEPTATSYTAAGSTIETITTLGTYAAPTATKCRFKEVDSTNHPGLYEVHFADARFAASNAKSLVISISGATNLVQADALVSLVSDDPFVAKPTNYASLSIDGSGRVDAAKVGGNTSIVATVKAIGRCTVTSGGSTTSVPTSALTLAGSAASGVVADQFKGRTVLFDGDTTTAGLRGATAAISASSASDTPTLTVGTLPASPASGDTFSII